MVHTERGFGLGSERSREQALFHIWHNAGTLRGVEEKFRVGEESDGLEFMRSACFDGVFYLDLQDLTLF